jgi:hypothetical protein
MRVRERSQFGPLSGREVWLAENAAADQQRWREREAAPNEPASESPGARGMMEYRSPQYSTKLKRKTRIRRAAE